MSTAGVAKEAESRMTTESVTQFSHEPQEQPKKSRLFMVLALVVIVLVILTVILARWGGVIPWSAR